MNMIKIRTLWLATSVPFALISIGWCYLYSSDLGLSLLTGIASALIFGLMMSLAAFGITRFLNLSALKWEVLLICMGSLGLVVSAVFFSTISESAHWALDASQPTES